MPGVDMSYSLYKGGRIRYLLWTWLTLKHHNKPTCDTGLAQNVVNKTLNTDACGYILAEFSLRTYDDW